MLDHTRISIGAKPGHTCREDDEYFWKGVHSISVRDEPLTGKRQAHARPQRTRADVAHEIHTLLTVDYPDADKVVPIMENLGYAYIAPVGTDPRNRANPD
ncbi:hypothetical protein [Corynebacterium sp. A21]|uniref:hypothetical protein n=1 Tax=Corynebacterium sp. A21 TaxID=3457318 RepID=UPI003FD49289